MLTPEQLKKPLRSILTKEEWSCVDNSDLRNCQIGDVTVKELFEFKCVPGVSSPQDALNLIIERSVHPIQHEIKDEIS